MAGVNKVILVGHLGRDPELRYTQSGQPVANFTLATSESYSKRDGEREERTEWHRIVAWGRLAEICAEYLSKGRQIYIEGRIQTREWEDREGEKRRTTEIVAREMQMLGRRGEANTSYDDSQAPAADSQAPAADSQAPATDSQASATDSQASATSTTANPGKPPPDDDIPF